MTLRSLYKKISAFIFCLSIGAGCTPLFGTSQQIETSQQSWWDWFKETFWYQFPEEVYVLVLNSGIRPVLVFLVAKDSPITKEGFLSKLAEFESEDQVESLGWHSYQQKKLSKNPFTIEELQGKITDGNYTGEKLFKIILELGSTKQHTENEVQESLASVKHSRWSFEEIFSKEGLRDEEVHFFDKNGNCIDPEGIFSMLRHDRIVWNRRIVWKHRVVTGGILVVIGGIAAVLVWYFVRKPTQPKSRSILPRHRRKGGSTPKNP